MTSGGHPGSSRTVRSLQLEQSTPDLSDVAGQPTPVPDPSIIPVEEESTDQGYRQHSIYADGDDTEDFETCFSPLSINSVHILGAGNLFSVSPETGNIPLAHPSDDPLTIRRLAETYDTKTASVFAHADNGSMACTASDAKLLFAYRPLAEESKVRLFDAGDHVHRPLGVGYLCVPH